MKTPNQQKGLGMLGWLVVLVIASFFLTCALKLLPVYLDAWTVMEIMEDIAEDPTLSSQSNSEIRKAISRRFDMNQVEVIGIKDVQIETERDKRLLKANYEKRIPFIQNIDVVVKFENIVYELPLRQ